MNDLNPPVESSHSKFLAPKVLDFLMLTKFPEILLTLSVYVSPVHRTLNKVASSHTFIGFLQDWLVRALIFSFFSQMHPFTHIP